MHNSRFPFSFAFPFALSILLTLLPAVGHSQQELASIVRAAPEECMLFFASTGELRADANGTATDRWLAQQEMQDCMLKLERAIGSYLEANPFESAALNELVGELPWLMLQRPFAVYVSEFDSLGATPSANFGFVMELGEKTDWIARILKDVVSLISEDEPAETKLKIEPIAGHDLYVSRKGDNELYFGIAGKRFVGTFGIGEIQKLLKQLESPAPSWAAQANKELRGNRLAAFFRINFLDVWEILKAQKVPVPDGLFLEDVTELVGALDVQSEESVSTMLLRSRPQPRGVLSPLDTEPMPISSISKMSAGVNSAVAFRFSPENFIELLAMIDHELDVNQLGPIVRDFKKLTGLDFNEDLIGSLDGTFAIESKINLINPRAGNLMSLQLRDPEAFRPKYQQLVEAVERIADSNPAGEFSSRESSGTTVFGLSSRTFNLSWCLVDNQILVALDRGTIRSHLRKRSRDDGKLSGDERVAEMFGNWAHANGNPIALSYTNLADTLKTVLPAVNAFLGGQTPHPDFPFSVNDLPSVEALTRGVNPNVLAVYRTESGFKLVERNVLPGNSLIASSGISIGLLLPAVQAVRHAARRTTVMNNIRQLVLASLNYELGAKSYPAAYTKNADGEKLLSWRVHLLPFLDQQALYEQFHLDEPWDSPHNKKLIKRMPPVFDNPALALEPGTTTFLGVAGDDTVLAAPQIASKNGEMTKGVSLAQITDGTSNTLLYVDANADHAVIWTKPDDFDPDDYDQIRPALAGTWAVGGIIVARCDGSVSFLRIETTDEQLRQMMRKSDGQTGE